MLVGFEDIIERAGPPDWHDEHGTPRYGAFHPKYVTVYNKRVAMYVIACQDCNKKFRVSHVYKDPISWPHMFIQEKYGGPPDTPPTEDEEGWNAWKEKFKEGQIPENYHFGDPPAHGCVGDTMNSIPLACEQWWERDLDLAWHRVEDKEVIFYDNAAEFFDNQFKSTEEEEDVPLDHS